MWRPHAGPGRGPKGDPSNHWLRLNESLGCDWSFEVVEQRILENEVVVVGRLTVHVEPELVKTAVGCQDIKRYESGDPISIGNDLKAASSDALKRAARLLGIGLELYDGDARQSGRSTHPRHNGNGHYRNNDTGNGSQRGSGNHRQGSNGFNGSGHGSNGRDVLLTLKQLKAIFAIGKSKGMHNKAVAALSNDMFGKVIDNLTRSEASRLIDHLKQ